MAVPQASALPGPAPCPVCRASQLTLQCVEQSITAPHQQVWTPSPQPARAMAPAGPVHVRYRFECGCGGEVDVVAPPDVDPIQAIVDAMNRQLPAHATVSMSIPTSRVGFLTRPAFPLKTVPAVSSGWSLKVADPERPSEPESPGPGPDLRRFDGSFIGYRAWGIDEWQLTGLNDGSPWNAGVNEAECRANGYLSYFAGAGAGRHPAPADGCHCGLYALARFENGKQWWDDDAVLGAVEAWADEDEHNHDRFFVHATGFRAQYAKVILLATSDEYPRAKNAAIRALATEHSADVCKREHLEDAAKEHGQLVPDELLQWAKEGDATALGSVYAQQLAAMQRYMQTSGLSGYASLGTPAKPVAAGPKGIKQHLKTPGPPGLGKHRKGDRAKDSKGVIWQCTSGGSAGTWAQEA